MSVAEEVQKLLTVKDGRSIVEFSWYCPLSEEFFVSQYHYSAHCRHSEDHIGCNGGDKFYKKEFERRIKLIRELQQRIKNEEVAKVTLFVVEFVSIQMNFSFRVRKMPM